MAYIALNESQGVDLDSLVAGSEKRESPLGTIISVNDTSKGSISEFMYVRATASYATIGTPFMIVPSSTVAGEVETLVPVRQQSGAKVGFNTTAITSGHYFWAQVAGLITVVTVGGAIGIGTLLKLTEAETGVEWTTHKEWAIGISMTTVTDSIVTMSVMPQRTVQVVAP